LADDADKYLPEDNEKPKSPVPPATNVRLSTLEEGQLEDVRYDDKRALTPSSPPDLDTRM